MNRVNFWELLTSKEAIVRYVKNHSQKVKSTPSKEISQRERIKRLVRTTVNTKHKDGRINSVGKDGKYASHSVSPYSKVFLENIEDRIQDLVLSLVKKGYLPISSCQGHSLDDERHVQLCFKSDKEIERFKNEILKAESLPSYLSFKVTKAEEFLNTKADVTKDGVSIQRTKLNNTNRQVSEYFQAMFWQYSDKWLILHMTIIDEVSGRLTVWNALKRWYYKTFKLESQTRQLTNHIRDNILDYDSCDY